MEHGDLSRDNKVSELEPEFLKTEGGTLTKKKLCGSLFFVWVLLSSYRNEV